MINHHFRQVVQALKFFTGIDKVCEPESRWHELGKGHRKVYTGVFLYDKPEKKNTKKKSKEKKNQIDDTSQPRKKIKGQLDNLEK